MCCCSCVLQTSLVDPFSPFGVGPALYIACQQLGTTLDGLSLGTPVVARAALGRVTVEALTTLQKGPPAGVVLPLFVLPVASSGSAKDAVASPLSLHFSVLGSKGFAG